MTMQVLIKKNIEVHNPTDKLQKLVNRLRDSKTSLVSEMREYR